MIQRRWGNPYEVVAATPILKFIEPDITGEQFYLAYRFNNDRILPIKKVKQYTRAARWLQMLNRMDELKNKPLKELKISIPEFYEHVKRHMELEKKNGTNNQYDADYQLPGDFPLTYQNLRLKAKLFKEKGYECLIDKMYGNQIAAKINDDVSEAHLLTLIENPHQYDDVLICMLYNTWANKNDYKTIDPQTVGVWRRKKGFEITLGREGNNAFNEKYIRQVNGLLPSCPLALVEHDDNNLDFLFTDESGYKYAKYVSICVVDSRTKLLLGKSYIPSKNPKQWQVYHAYLDAMYYLRHLTGGWHLPHEMKSDNWAKTSLAPFYEKVAKRIPAAHGNKHRGYIEPFFRRPLWKRAQKLISLNNYTGNNMTAKFRGVNQDILRFDEKNRPMVGNQAETQIENFFHLLRNMPDIKRNKMDSPSTEELFKMQWQSMHKDDKLSITDEQFLLTFGIKHQPQGRTLMITNAGITVQINNTVYKFDMPEAWMYNKYPGANVSVVYDPFDMSRVMVTNYDDIRFIANTAQLSPRAMKDYQTGSRTYLNAILSEKNDQVADVITKRKERIKKVNPGTFSAEAVLQGGGLLKELKNEAEAKMIEEIIEGDREEWLDDNVDYSIYQ